MVSNEGRSVPKINTAYRYRRNRISMFDCCIVLTTSILCAIFLYPVLNALALSFSSPQILAYGNIGIFPAGFSLEAYKYLLQHDEILRFYINTIYYAVTATAFSLFITSITAYPLTFNNFFAKKAITLFITITMFVSGGLIPSYLLRRGLHMMNTPFVYILPGLNAWNIIIFRTFFSGIPVELRETATIDGAGHFRTLFQIILPLSLPLLATNALFTMVGTWNDYFTALIYLTDQKLHPIQMFLRSIVTFLDYQALKKDLMFGDILKIINQRTVRSAAIILTITPILCVYPFLQKYFAKGIIVGAIKG